MDQGFGEWKLAYKRTQAAAGDAVRKLTDEIGELKRKSAEETKSAMRLKQEIEQLNQELLNRESTLQVFSSFVEYFEQVRILKHGFGTL